MADIWHYFPRFLMLQETLVRAPGMPVEDLSCKGVRFSVFRACAQSLLGLEPSLENLFALSDEQACRICKLRYWDPLHADEIFDQALAEILFDFYACEGAVAIRVLQQALNTLGVLSAPLVVDGVFSLTALQAMLRAHPVSVYRSLRTGRVRYYQQMVAERPAMGKHLGGWLRRVESFPVR
jgi:lysozyme family protein